MPEFRFLVDVNLPKHFSFFNNENFIHVYDINPSMRDSEIWIYAMKHNLIIITKDSDFYFRATVSASSPKIIYLQLGNQTLNQLHSFFQNNWDKILELLKAGSFILATKRSLELLF
jgi:predicted nuclease of predicted toxin-antitoxin system